jgi:hypothetical protein
MRRNLVPTSCTQVLSKSSLGATLTTLLARAVLETLVLSQTDVSPFKIRNKAMARCSLTVCVAIAFKVIKDVNTRIKQAEP